jgi:hypothetical protein
MYDKNKSFGGFINYTAWVRSLSDEQYTEVFNRCYSEDVNPLFGSKFGMEAEFYDDMKRRQKLVMIKLLT